MAGTSTFEEFQSQALELTLDQRTRLAARLIASLDEEDDFELDAEWGEELRRRVRDLDEGRSRTVSHEAAMSHVRQRLEQKRQG